MITGNRAWNTGTVPKTNLWNCLPRARGSIFYFDRILIAHILRFVYRFRWIWKKLDAISFAEISHSGSKMNVLMLKIYHLSFREIWGSPDISSSFKTILTKLQANKNTRNNKYTAENHVTASVSTATPHRHHVLIGGLWSPQQLCEHFPL